MHNDSNNTNIIDNIVVLCPPSQFEVCFSLFAQEYLLFI